MFSLSKKLEKEKVSPPSGTTSKCDPVIQRFGVFDLDLLLEEDEEGLKVPLPLILPRRLPTASVVTSRPAPTIHFLISAAAFRCAGDR